MANANSPSAPFSGNVSNTSSNPLDTAAVLQKGINGLSLQDFMQLTGMIKSTPGAGNDDLVDSLGSIMNQKKDSTDDSDAGQPDTINLHGQPTSLQTTP